MLLGYYDYTLETEINQPIRVYHHKKREELIAEIQLREKHLSGYIRLEPEYDFLRRSLIEFCRSRNLWVKSRLL